MSPRVFLEDKQANPESPEGKHTISLLERYRPESQHDPVLKDSCYPKPLRHSKTQRPRKDRRDAKEMNIRRRRKFRKGIASQPLGPRESPPGSLSSGERAAFRRVGFSRSNNPRIAQRVAASAKVAP